MPFLVRYPGNIKAGTVSESIILNVDFAPTLMEYAGLKIPADIQGRSFAPLLRGEKPKDWRSPRRYRAIQRFMVPMHAKNRKGAFHEPPGDGTGPTGCRPGPLTRRVERFMVPMHAVKRKEALQEPQCAAGIHPQQSCYGGRVLPSEPGVGLESGPNHGLSFGRSLTN